VDISDWKLESTFAKEGCQVYVFDPQKKVLDNEDLHKNIKMYKYRIGKVLDIELRNFDSLHEWRRMTSIMDELKHLDDGFDVDYLKLDVDGDELDFLEDMATKKPRILERFRQINMEINLGAYGRESWKDVGKYYRYFIALEKRGFRLFASKTDPIKHQSYLLNGRIVHTNYQLAWGKCSNVVKTYEPYNGTDQEVETLNSKSPSILSRNEESNDD